MTGPSSPRSSLFLDISAELAGHLAIALRQHRQWAARAGLETPPELADLAEALAFRAMRGQEGTPLDDLWSARDREVVTRRLLTYEETGHALGCSQRTVKRLVATGELTAVQVGRGTVRVRAADLDAYVQDLPALPTAGAS